MGYNLIFRNNLPIFIDVRRNYDHLIYL